MRYSIILTIIILLIACKPPRETTRQQLNPVSPAGKFPAAAITSGSSDISVKFSGDAAVVPKSLPQSAFQTSLNPSGDPIGGGPGFRMVSRAADAQFVVSDANMLGDALRRAKSGDIIFIPGTVSMDLSGRRFSIPGGVTIASDRGLNDSQGALLWSNTHYHQDSVDSYNDYLLVTAGRGVCISGLRLRGPSAEIDEFPDRVACGIKGMHGYLEVSNCELSHWLKWAIDLAVAQGDRIHHNYIHRTRRAGFGYGIWVRGAIADKAPAKSEISIIEANLLENCRHEIASGGQASSSFIARHNYIARHDMSNHMIDRHHQGAYTEVSNNLIAPSNHYIFHGMAVAPADALVFRGNWCDEKDIRRVFPNHTQKGWNIQMSANELGGSWRVNQPQLRLEADVLSGQVPLSVRVKAIGTDPASWPINAYLWDLEDGRKMLLSSSQTAEITYRKPGVYSVRVRARNSYGLLSEPVSLTLIVRDRPPAEPTQLFNSMTAFWDFDDPKTWAFDALFGKELRYKDPIPLLLRSPGGMAIQRVSPPADLVQNPYVPNALARTLQPGTGDFSFNMVFRLDKLPEAGKHVGLLGYGAGSETEAGYVLALRQSEPSELCFFISNGRGRRDRVVIGKGIQAGRWYHITVSVSRENGLSAWLDGVHQANNVKLSTGRDDIFHDSHHFGIPGRFVLYPQASIEQVAFWCKALNSGDAALLWNDGHWFGR